MYIVIENQPFRLYRNGFFIDLLVETVYNDDSFFIFCPCFSLPSPLPPQKAGVFK